jgi:hypothetical protein
MRRSVKLAAIGLAALSLTFAGLGISNVLGQEDFIFVPADQATGVNDHFQFHVYQAESTNLYYGQFRYERDVTTPTLDAPAGWVDGDRVRYDCGWTFLTYRQWIVGRATYTSIDPAAKDEAPRGALINDKYMGEGIRRYNGTYEGPGGDEQFDEDCTNPPSGDGVSSAGPSNVYPDLSAGHDFGSLPVVVFYHGPHDLEIRDFADLDDTIVPMDGSLRVQIVAQDERRVTVVGYDQLPSEEWRARVEVHFDVMVPGGIVPGTDHPVELRTTLEPEPSPSPSPTPLTADFDGDGDVDFDDLRAFVEAWIAES